MDIQSINNPFGKINGIQGANKFQPVSPVKKAGADGGNPFAGEAGFVGLGIQDGSVQTSAAQMGKEAKPMRQIAIA